VQSLDALDDAGNPSELTWQGQHVSNHHVIIPKNKCPQRVIVKVHWANDEPTWVNMDAIWMQQPELLVAYAIEKGLSMHPDWCWIATYLNFHCKCFTIQQAFKSAVEQAPKYKFGVEVLQSLGHAKKMATLMEGGNRNLIKSSQCLPHLPATTKRRTQPPLYQDPIPLCI